MKKAEPNTLQIQGSVKALVTPNDKLTKCLFHRDAAKYARMIQADKPAKVDEGFTVKKKKITTQYWVELIDGLADMTPLDEFDRAILDVCISTQVDGLSGITFLEIARLMTGGKSNKKMTRVNVEQKTRILRSVEKLMCTRIRIDFTELAETGKYPKLPKSGRLTSTILPCKIVEGLTVNGQRGVDAVFFLDESPLLILARAKNRQLLSYPVGLLNVPKQNNTSSVTQLKFYVTRRVHEIKAHEELKPIITFADVFEKCGLGDATNSIKRNARKNIRDVFEHLKAQGVILEFEFEKVDGMYRAIKFRY